MNRYEVKVRTDKTFIVEANSREEAERTALEDANCVYGHTFMRSVIGVKDLTGDPYELLGELAMELERFAFAGEWCRYCGGVPRVNKSHSASCIIERARHCAEQHRRKLDENHPD